MNANGEHNLSQQKKKQKEWLDSISLVDHLHNFYKEHGKQMDSSGW